MNRKLEVYYSEDSVVNIFAQPGKYLKDNHARCFLKEMEHLSLDKDFTGTDFRVLMAIIANLDFDNKVSIPQKQLGEKLNIQRQEVTKSIKKLISKEYLHIVDKIGRQNIYMFNPNIVFKSKAKNLKELKHAWDNKTLPNTQKYPIDIDTDLEPNLEDKLDDRVEQLSKQFDIPQNKVRQMILSLVNQALSSDEQDVELPY